MSKIDLQQERESLKSTLFTEEIDNVRGALYILKTNISILQDSITKEGLMEDMKRIWFESNIGCGNVNSFEWYIAIIEEIINKIEKESR
jgi:hypothetical protein